MSTKSGTHGAEMEEPGGGETTTSSGEHDKSKNNMKAVCTRNSGCPKYLGYPRSMNDSDWLRKHLRGKTQRAVAETSDSRLRRFVGKVLKRLRPETPPKAAQD